jgi:hypothetical protein
MYKQHREIHGGLSDSQGLKEMYFASPESMNLMGDKGKVLGIW